MPRKLKTYQTSVGFLDLAIAAPSMKAALEAWGSRTNLFHHGFAKETDDPVIVAATMAKPGVVLRRAVGSSGGFSEHPQIPKDLTSGDANFTAEKHARKTQPPPSVHDKTAREATAAYAREQKQRDRERRRQEAFRELERKRRELAIANAEAALEKARQIHDKKMAEVAAARSALDRQSEAEEIRWATQREQLEAALGRARG